MKMTESVGKDEKEAATRKKEQRKTKEAPLCSLICVMVLSSGRLCWTNPIPPSLLAHLLPPHPSSHTHTHTPCPLKHVQLAEEPRYQAYVRGPAGAGGPETEVDSVVETASAQAVGTAGPAQLDPVAPHVHRQNTKICSQFTKTNFLSS